MSILFPSIIRCLNWQRWYCFRLKQCHMLNLLYVYKQFCPETSVFHINANVICEMRSILSSLSNSAGIVYVVDRPKRNVIYIQKLVKQQLTVGVVCSNLYRQRVNTFWANSSDSMCDRALYMKMTRGTNLMQQLLFIIINNSTCFGHLYVHLQECRLCTAACGVQH